MGKTGNNLVRISQATVFLASERNNDFASSVSLFELILR